MTHTIDNSMIMKCVAYQNGVSIGDVTIEDISEVLKLEHTFVWLGLREANSELLGQIQQEFGLHDLAVGDACAAHQRPKIEEYGDSLFIVLHTAHLSGDQVEFGETHFFLGPRFLVTVRHGYSSSHSKVRERCEAMPKQLAKGPGFVVVFRSWILSSITMYRSSTAYRHGSMCWSRLFFNTGRADRPWKAFTN